MEIQMSPLDSNAKSIFIEELENKLKAEVIGQDEEITKIIKLIETHITGYNDPEVPVGVVLCLGPSGTGKTVLTTKLAEHLFGNVKALIRLNCADFKDNYQTNRLIGAPPGYSGYKDKSVDSYISQDKLDEFHTEDLKLTIVVLDEIEKANVALYEYFLAIFNDGEGRVNSNTVSFRNTLFIMTSNLGSRKMSQSLGFSPQEVKHMHDSNISSAMSAVKKHFEPEFINRIDEICVFKPLSREVIEKIFDVQICKIRKRFITNKKVQPQFVFRILDSARDELIKQGFDPEYGARPLIRILKRHIINKLAAMTLSGQIFYGDLVIIGFDGKDFTYNKYEEEEVNKLTEEEWLDFQQNIK